MPFVTVASGLSMYYVIPSSPIRGQATLDPSRPTVLLLHPRFFDSYFFNPQFRDARLARGYNLLAIDHHYHGKTQAPLDDKPYDFWKVARDLLSALDKLKVKTVQCVLGNSLGAGIALRVAMLAPDRVQSLVLCGTTSDLESEENREQFLFLRNACYERADDGSDQLASDVVHALHWIYFGEDSSAKELIDEWMTTTEFRPSNKKLINKMFSSLLDREPLPKSKWDLIKCPVLILHGGDDVPYPPSAAQELYDNLYVAKREMTIIDRGPHFFTWTNAAQVNSLLADFLDTVTGTDSVAASLCPVKRATVQPEVDFDADNSIASPKIAKKRGFFKRLLQ